MAFYAAFSAGINVGAVTFSVLSSVSGAFGSSSFTYSAGLASSLTASF